MYWLRTLTCKESIAVCIDQGSDGWSGVHFLRYRPANLLVAFDWNHRAWNDASLAIGQSRPRTLVQPHVVLRDEDSCERTDPSFQACILGICEDRGLDAGFVMGSDDEQEQLHQELFDCLEKKLPKIGLTRWFESWS